MRVRAHLSNPGMLHRVTIHRSAKNIYAQLIDDAKHATVASCSSLELKDLSGDKKDVAKSVGQEIAKRALQQGIERVVFDRGNYLYHGRVKSFVDGLRDGGLQV